MRKSPYGINRKKRNLRYIREKNRLNRFEPLMGVFRVSGVIPQEDIEKGKESTEEVRRNL